MSLYKITTDKIEPVPRTTFAAEQILERNDIQRMLREDISPIGDDLMVIAEEYGEWEKVNRRIDLLCLNSRGDLVVVEIKRTEVGGHMELQAIRYAAMVSSMTLDQAVQCYSRMAHCEEDDARSDIIDFLQVGAGSDAELTGDVRIVLVSADFSTEVATAVLWLNRHDLDITCIRLRPYKMGHEILIDATQIIPLPEAADYEVKLRTQEQEQRKASGRWQGELQRFWSGFITRHQNEHPQLAGRVAPRIQNLIFKRGNGYVLQSYVLKDITYFQCDITLPKDNAQQEAAIAFLSGKTGSIEKAFGGELNAGKDKRNPVFCISQTLDRGWSSPASEWPDLQDQLLENLLRLESAVQLAIEELKNIGED
ncbi:MAG: hypothetical protein P1U89_15615 [Verrucomicrobiales bacterium]|nr:hypothetical protein [Verrucomicrobiales bacterium]